MGIKYGMDGKLYYTAGARGSSPAWSELTNAKDVTLNLETGEADVTTRGNGGWKAAAATLKSATIEFEMIWDTEDVGFTAIKDAYFNNTILGVAVMDGDIAGDGQGLLADCMVTNFSRKEPLEEAMTVSVTLKPTYGGTAPEWKD